MKIIYAGIDPDSKGAIAFIGAGKHIQIYDKMDPWAREVLLWCHRTEGVCIKACLEGANTSPQQGRVSAGVQMRSSGFWEGRLDVINVVPTIVYAVTWRAEILQGASPVRPSMAGMDKKAAGKVSRKHRSNMKTACVEKACELFPEIVDKYIRVKGVTKEMREGRSEAILIAEYCRRLYTGQTKKSKEDIK